MTSLLLATVVAMRLAGAPQTFEFQAEAGKAYHIAVTSHCSCYYPQPRVVVPEVEILDASGSRIARPTSDLRGTSRGTANYEITGELTFTAPADGTYLVRVTPAHVDGYVSFSPDSHCVVVRQHDGSLYTLVGRWHGLLGNDHVRLEGRFVPETRCGGQGGFEVTEVQAVWADDNHRSTYYDHLKDGNFRGWLSHNRPREWERERERERREPPRS